MNGNEIRMMKSNEMMILTMIFNDADDNLDAHDDSNDDKIMVKDRNNQQE